jgi:malic enzyme
MDDDFRKNALAYHRLPRPGKLSVEATKRMANQRDLALAYSPGVAAPCEAIAADPSLAREYTARGAFSFCTRSSREAAPVAPSRAFTALALAS